MKSARSEPSADYEKIQSISLAMKYAYQQTAFGNKIRDEAFGKPLADGYGCNW